MSSTVISIRSTYHSILVEFDSAKIIAKGTSKDVYFSKCDKYAICFYRKPLKKENIDRLTAIVLRYKKAVLEDGDDKSSDNYWKKLFNWPIDIVQWGNKTGIICEKFDSKFFFKYGSVNSDKFKLKGTEKQGKWFTTPKNKNFHLDPKEHYTWLDAFDVCLRLSRAIRRLHANGLAHSDLSYKNILVDLETSSINIIDIDSVVVPGKYEPEVIGTPDFIAPEVLRTSSLKVGDPNKNLPNIKTDLHALAVLIYMYLLLRHPLRGGRILDYDDPDNDDFLAMGSKALFIENDNDKSNMINLTDIRPEEKLWCDTKKIPYTILGTKLSSLIERAFIEGLHSPNKRPTADEWEMALLETRRQLVPCQNSKCTEKWFVFNKNKICPFCGSQIKEKILLLDWSIQSPSDKTLPLPFTIANNNTRIYDFNINHKKVNNEKYKMSPGNSIAIFTNFSPSNTTDALWYIMKAENSDYEVYLNDKLVTGISLLDPTLKNILTFKDRVESKSVTEGSVLGNVLKRILSNGSKVVYSSARVYMM